MSYIDIGDNELIYLIRGNNQEAKDYLIDRYQKRIYGMINGFMNKNYMRGLDYEDFYHECFIVFLKCLDLFDEEYNFYNYVYGAVDKVLYKLIAKEKKKRELISLEYIIEDKGDYLLDHVDDSTTLYKESEIREYIKQNFDDIDIKIIEYKLRGYNYLEIASNLSISQKSTYRRVKKIKSIMSTFDIK